MNNSLSPIRRRLSPIKRRLKAQNQRFRTTSTKLYHLTRAKLELRSLLETYRRRYGGAIVTTIDPQDEMYRFISEHWDWPYHETPMEDRAYALRAYLASGERHLGILEDILFKSGHPLPNVQSFLEFACGHGRMTRFLVHRVPPSKVTVSDINCEAVEFLSRTLGVQGFCSVADPRELDHNGRYEAIFVGSLFTHLNHEYWGEWLQRLYSLLNDKGVLVFSTHGLRVLDEIYGSGAKSKVKTVTDGFFFLETNETNGRLATSYYGATFVTEPFVRRVVQAKGLGKLAAFYPAKLNYQDIFVLERT